MTKINWLICVLNMVVLATMAQVGLGKRADESFSQVDDQTFSTNSDKLFDVIQSSLFEDKANVYTLRKVFFYSPNVDPVLLKVIYNITYDSNKMSDLSLCPQAKSSGIQQITYTYGWTSTTVYHSIHPSLLNAMQMPVPFLILAELNKRGQAGPHGKTLLWDGSYDLPTLVLKLRINSLPCLPSQDQIDEALRKVTTLLKTTTRLELFVDDTCSSKDYVLPIEVTSGDHILDYRHGKTFLYSSFAYGIFIYIILISFVLLVYCRRGHALQTDIEGFIDTHSPLYLAAIVLFMIYFPVAVHIGVFMRVMWSSTQSNSGDKTLLIALGCIPALQMFVTAVFIGGCQCFYKCGNNTSKGPHKNMYFRNFAVLFTAVMAANRFLYYFPQTLILQFVYPIDVTATIVYTIAIYFSTSAAIAILRRVLFKEYGLCFLMVCVCLIVSFIFFWSLSIEHVLNIGNNPGVMSLIIISLLPSALIALISWFISKKVFDNFHVGYTRQGLEISSKDKKDK